MTTKNVCIYHRADFDGIFCREIGKKFLPKDTDFIGWDYGDPVPQIAEGAMLYMLDISVERLMDYPNLIWIDHHKSAMEKFSSLISGYRIDGVAACRLAWQWFMAWQRTESLGELIPGELPTKENFVERRVLEPVAVRLAGEYDIWDKRDPRTDVFQFGLRSEELKDADWKCLLVGDGQGIVEELLGNGEMLQRYQQQTDAEIVKHRSFVTTFEGLTFLVLNTARCNSLTFASRDVPETGHDALMGFWWNGTKWTVSMYHANHRKDLDLSQIAVKFGGGGHRGACGFQTQNLPFIGK